MKKMKKTLIPMLVAMVALLTMFQVSFVGAQDADEEATEDVMLLADTHEEAGISCSDCHEEDPPASKVSQDTCLTCHEDYKELAASYLDPHNAHISYSDCGDCHHIHRTSEQICQGCHHTFRVQAP